MKLLAAFLFAMTFAGVAAADIRFDDRRPRPPPTEEPVEPPVAEPAKGGCAARVGPAFEWMFGFVVLSLGLAGLRRFSPRRAMA